jgi:hypothetical protein
MVLERVEAAAVDLCAPTEIAEMHDLGYAILGAQNALEHRREVVARPPAVVDDRNA